MASSSKQHFQTFTIGKLDAGMAILIGERAHLIEFPSLLLPPGSTSGSIVSISVHRNVAAEQTHARAFSSLQSQILQTYGTESPQAPVLSLRNTTQTSVTLEWGKLELANAKLRGVEIYRNGTRLAAIPNPGHNTSTKLSSLSMDTDYTFQLVMKTTAGTYPSNVIRVRTHTINDTSGISVCFGTVQDPHHLHQAKIALDQMGAKYSDKIQIDTTHFVCTTPAGPVNGSGPSVEYQKALQLTLPVVEPGWVLACLHEKKMVAISQHMLGSSPAFNPLPSATFERPTSPSLPPSPHTRASEDLHSFPQQQDDADGQERGSEDPDAGISPETRARREEEEANERERNRPRTPGGGVLNRGFKFPLSSAEGGPPTPPPGSETFPPSPPSPVRKSSPPPPAVVVEEEPAPIESEPEPTPVVETPPSASVESVQSPIEVAISPPTPPPVPTVVEPEPESEPEVAAVVVEEQQVEDASVPPPPPPEIRIEEAETEEVVVMETVPVGSTSEEDAEAEAEAEGGKVQGEKEVEVEAVVEEPVASLEEVEIAEPEPVVIASEEIDLVGEKVEDDAPAPAPPTITVEGEEDDAEEDDEEEEEGDGLKEVELEGEGEKAVEETKVGAGGAGGGGAGGGGGGGKKKKNGKKGKGGRK